MAEATEETLASHVADGVEGAIVASLEKSSACCSNTSAAAVAAAATLGVCPAEEGGGFGPAAMDCRSRWTIRLTWRELAEESAETAETAAAADFPPAKVRGSCCWCPEEDTQEAVAETADAEDAAWR